jgi:guanylate cyclase
MAESYANVNTRKDERHQPAGQESAEMNALFDLRRADCQSENSDDPLHDSVRCLGLDGLVSTYHRLADVMLASIKSACNVTLDDTVGSGLVHLVTCHLNESLRRFAELLTEARLELRAEYDVLSAVLPTCGMVVHVIGIALTALLASRLSVCHEVLMALFSRLSPAIACSNPQLLRVLTDRSELERTKMGVAQEILSDHAEEGVIVSASDGMINYINSGVSRILGYQPAQLIGQQVTQVAHTDSRKIVDKQIQLIRQRQAGAVVDMEVECQTNDGNKVMCSVTFQARFGADGQSLEELVLVLRDLRIVQQKRMLTEMEKARSERLLYAIIPRSIAAQLGQQERVCFEVPLATICFIDIIKFSQFSAHRSAQEIMGTLGGLFGAFEEKMHPTYPLLLKIKMTGDCLMTAANLFEHDETGQHAQQMVSWAVRALEALDEFNTRQNLALDVRIGINSGGPIFAGVLGKEKPLFDIIGDTINVAARLQSSSRPNTIQMSQATYVFVRDLGYACRRQDDVHLKGKELPLTTYLLTVDSLRAGGSGATSLVHSLVRSYDVESDSSHPRGLRGADSVRPLPQIRIPL